MSQLIGTASNQVPTNGDLGTAAFMDTSAFYGTGLNPSFRNKIINGAMLIDQRNVGASLAIVNAPYSLDRWQVQCQQSGKLTVQQDSSAPAGFIKSLKFTVAATATLSSSDSFRLIQKIEGTNCTDLNWGTSAGVPVTVSFWVKSSVAGMFGASIQNNTGERGYPYSYSVNSANVWEYKTITVPADTTGTWSTDSTGVGLYMNWSIGTGSALSGPAGVWLSGDYKGVTGATNLTATNGATWQITGVQVERGTQATAFEHRSFGTELTLCQRYYEKSYPIGVAPANSALTDTRAGPTNIFNGTNGETQAIKFSVLKRTPPTITFYRSSATSASDGQWSIYNGGWLGGNISPNACYDSYFTGGFSGLTSVTNYASYITSGGWAASAEL